MQLKTRGNIWELFPNREHLLFCNTEHKELLEIRGVIALFIAISCPGEFAPSELKSLELKLA